MAFSAADYQSMAQARKRNRNGGQQAANQGSMSNSQMESEASQRTSRQVPKGTQSLNRDRPGVPRMPVQGIPDRPTNTPSAPPPGSPGSADAGTPELQGLQQMPRSILGMQRMAGELPGGVDPSIRLAGSMGSSGSDDFVGPPEPGSPGTAMRLPDDGSTGFMAGAENYNNPDNIADPRPTRSPSALGGEESSDPFDEFAEERAMYEENLAAFEAQKEGAGYQIRRDLAAQQRRLAETNALSGRSGLGGGYGGAMATSGVMGAAALAEAERISQDKINQLQLGWMEKVMSFNESQRQREFDRETSETAYERDLNLESIRQTGDLPSGIEGGTGGATGVGESGGTGGSTGEGGSSSTSAGAGTDTDTGTGSEDAPGSARDMWDDGWRRSADGGWINEDGESWGDVYPNQPSPYSDAVTYGTTLGATMEDSDPRVSDPWFFRDDLPNNYDGPALDIYNERFAWVGDYPGGMTQAWFDGELTQSEYSWLRGLATEDSGMFNDYEDGPQENFGGPFQQNDPTEEGMTYYYPHYGMTESDMYSMDDGTTLNGDEIMDVAELLEDANPAWAEIVNNPPFGRFAQGPFQQNAGLLKEVAAFMLSRKSDSGNQVSFNGPDFIGELSAHLQQAGYFQPERF